MKSKSLLVFSFLLMPLWLFAQQRITVSGVVTEQATGEPAIGVSILVKGTTNGTVTGIDGSYTLSDVPAQATLVFSYIGMTTVEQAVNGRSRIDVMMSVDRQYQSRRVCRSSVDEPIGFHTGETCGSAGGQCRTCRTGSGNSYPRHKLDQRICAVICCGWIIF